MEISTFPKTRMSAAATDAFEPVPVLDIATVVGGAFLSATGLMRGGLRGWLSTSLGTLLVYRGVLSLQEFAARQCSDPQTKRRGERGEEGNQRVSTPAQAPDPLVEASHSIPRNPQPSGNHIDIPL